MCAWISTLLFLPFQSLIRAKNYSLVWEGRYPGLLSVNCTMEKLAANWNEPNTDLYADARTESITPCWCCWWQVRNPVHTRQDDPLHVDTTDKSTSHAAVQEVGLYIIKSVIDWVGLNLKSSGYKFSGAYKGQLGFRGAGMCFKRYKLHTYADTHAHTQAHYKCLSKCITFAIKTEVLRLSPQLLSAWTWSGSDSGWNEQCIPWSGN